MGKYNRQTATRKLQKLTDDLIVGVVAPELKEKMGVLMEKQPQEKVTKIALLTKQVQLNNARAGGKTTAVKQATIKSEEVKKEMPKPVIPTPEVKVADSKLLEIPEGTSKMNVYQKIQLARKIIAGMAIKKSGANDTEGFNYFELADYLPMLNDLNDRIGLMTNFSMTNEMGTLKIFNTDKPKEIAEFSIPTADLQMSGDGKQAEGIQILGGKTTYLRRYLMQIAYEISVKDSVDDKPKAPAKPIEDLDPRDIQAIDEANDLENLGTICQNIRQRKGFKQHQALLKHYTEKKQKLGL